MSGIIMMSDHQMQCHGSHCDSVSFQTAPVMRALKEWELKRCPSKRKPSLQSNLTCFTWERTPLICSWNQWKESCREKHKLPASLLDERGNSISARDKSWRNKQAHQDSWLFRCSPPRRTAEEITFFGELAFFFFNHIPHPQWVLKPCHV